MRLVPSLQRRGRSTMAITTLIAALLSPLTVAADQVTLFAAASLKEALEDVVARFVEDSEHTVALSLAGSSLLARQIAQGAPADIFISANPEWMDVLEADRLIVPETRHDLLGNSLVLIAPGSTHMPLELSSRTDLSPFLRDGKLALALVDAVPAGIYGKAALQSLGLWDRVADHVVQLDNVRAALALVALGEASLGVVYATDALAAANVSVVGIFPPDTHPSVVYPVAGVAGRESAASSQFLDYLRGPEAKAAFEKWGFTVLDD